jgi:hypothetical protein
MESAKKTCYWACFKNENGNIFRFDTRIYFQPIDKPSDKDKCICAVIGMNPGSAKPKNMKSNEIQEIVIGKDKTLPNIKSIFFKAYGKTNFDGAHKYIQVLNLFYLCNEKASVAKSQAINNISKYLSESYICPSEKNKFNFIFYAWGLTKGIDEYKTRFIDKNNSLSDYYIWFDKEKGEIKTTLPNKNDNVKHPIGLPHGKIIFPIKNLINMIK